MSATTSRPRWPTSSSRPMNGLTNDAPAFAARSAWFALKQSVTFVRTSRSANARVATRPWSVSGTLTTTFGWIAARWIPSRTIPSASVAVTSAETGPSTIEQISRTTSSKTRPDFATSEGFVVTPSTTPQGTYLRIWSTSALSRKSFIGGLRRLPNATPRRGRGASIGGASSPGVEAPVDGLQALVLDVRVDLGRRDVGVAEHLLDRAEVRAAREQVRREGVAQHVGVDGPRHARARPPRAPDAQDAVAVEGLPRAREEEPVRALPREPRARGLEVDADGRGRGRAERHPPLLAPLADAARDAVLQAHVLDAPVARLLHARAGRVEALEERAVAHLEGRGRRVLPRALPRRRLEEGRDGALPEHLRQGRRALPRGQARGRVDGDTRIRAREAVEGTERGEAARHGRRRAPRRALAVEPVEQPLPRDPRDRAPLAGGQRREDGAHVAPVRLERVARRADLDVEVVEPRVDHEGGVVARVHRLSESGRGRP